MVIRKYYLVELRKNWVILNQLVYNYKGEALYSHYCTFKVSDIDTQYLKYVISYCTHSKKGLYPAIAVPNNAYYCIDLVDINEYIKKDGKIYGDINNN